jgi:hypothetical protein
VLYFNFLFSFISYYYFLYSTTSATADQWHSTITHKTNIAWWWPIGVEICSYKNIEWKITCVKSDKITSVLSTRNTPGCYATNCLPEKLDIAHLLKKFFAFMEPEGTLPCSKGPATGPCLIWASWTPSETLHPIYIHLKAAKVWRWPLTSIWHRV